MLTDEDILNIINSKVKPKRTTKKDLIVYYKGVPVTKLSEHLVKSKKLNANQIQVLKDLHVERLGIEEQMSACEDRAELKQLFKTWTEIQRRLQTAWGFEANDSFHRFWEVPKCSCNAVMDNLERLGTPFKIVNNECLVHGS